MVHSLTGTVTAHTDSALVLSVGPLALQLQVPHPSAFQVGSSCSVQVYMHWNQEQGPSLFGFSDELEKAVFLLVISCSGLGPKIGLAVLRDLGSRRFLEVIQAGDDRALSKVSGIGPKKAEQMIVQLKHKVAKLLDSGIKIAGAEHAEQWHNITQVLESLNYSRTEIASALKHVRESDGAAGTSFDQLMRQALSFLAKRS